MINTHVACAGLKFAPDGAAELFCGLCRWCRSRCSLCFQCSAASSLRPSVAVAHKLADGRSGGFRSWLEICERACRAFYEFHAGRSGGHREAASARVVGWCEVRARRRGRIILWTVTLASFAFFSSSSTVGAFGVVLVAVAHKLADERLGGLRSWLQICAPALGLATSPYSMQRVGEPKKRHVYVFWNFVRCCRIAFYNDWLNHNRYAFCCRCIFYQMFSRGPLRHSRRSVA
jgi:hypothetical protein